MKKVLSISSNNEVISVIKRNAAKFIQNFDMEYLSKTGDVVRYINYELPEIKVLDYTSEDVECDIILSTINDDPWLHYGGIIAVCKNRNQNRTLEDRKDSNLLCILTKDEFIHNFTRILRILLENQQFLFHRGMQEEMGSEENGIFSCDNDPLDIQFYSNFLISYLYNTDRISMQDRTNLQMTLIELLNNALEHGNLEISYSEKTELMMKNGDIFSLIAEKNKNPKYAKRKITISYSIGIKTSSISIKDEGNGFDWRKYVAENAETPEESYMHGRGIQLSKGMVDSITYNEKGNQVTVHIKNQQNTSNAIPGLIRTFETLTFKDKEIICRQNEPSNDLYFIVTGRYAVYSGRKLVSVLTPNDMFIGEMAFLLNNRRSATVLASGNCKLIRIPKKDFLNMIRKNPHYGIFLSKMLAQRLVNQTQRTIELNNKLRAYL